NLRVRLLARVHVRVRPEPRPRCRVASSERFARGGLKMRTHLLRTTFIAFALVAGTGLAVAQDKPANNMAPPGVDPAQQNSPQPGNKAEENATQEPSSRAPTAKPEDNQVLVNGRLNVPGAPENSDAVPAKFSAKNDADDQLITLGYTFKQLTP